MMAIQAYCRARGSDPNYRRNGHEHGMYKMMEHRRELAVVSGGVVAAAAYNLRESGADRADTGTAPHPAPLRPPARSAAAQGHADRVGGRWGRPGGRFLFCSRFGHGIF